ncbi:MAG TPA: zinc-ribbon domain-containing protein [Enhygromyxa sp.]|nr:zinc-ribbon domain-containing protein [Enhygromyxa sp.]
MIVRCENCGTEFGFDDRQVGEGITVRCSVCKHVFKVESPSAASAGWQIRTTDAMSFTAPNVATLREWIDEGRLHPDDQVSRTGRSWMRLGDMPEFARAFAGFEDVAPVVSPVRPTAPAKPPPAPSSMATLPPARPPVAPQSQRPTLSPPRSAPAPAAAPVASNRPPSAPARAPERPVIPPSTRAPNVVDDDDVLDVDEDDETVAAMPAVTREPSGPRRTEQARQRPEPEPAAPKPAPKPQAKLDDVEPDDLDDDLDDDFVGKRRGISPGLIAFLGVIAAVGIMFGVPSIRTKLLSLGQGGGSDQQQPAEPVIGPEIRAAEQALEQLGTAALARAEADLQRAIDAGSADAATMAAMKVTLADLLLSRAIAYQMAAALDADQRESFRRRAAEDHEAGKRLIDSLEGAPDVDRLAEVRALARLAAGRPDAEVLPLVPDDAIETKLIVQAAILWQDLDAPVPVGLVAGLGELRTRSGLGESALALALVRAKDTVGARNAAERLLVGAEDQVVALAVRTHLGADESEAETGTEGGETGGAEADPSDDPTVAKAPPRPGDDGGSAGAANEGSGGSGASFDKLVERGCKQVRSGEADAGIKTLMRAFDLKDNNLDVLVCLADGYAAKGQNTQAVNFYDRALQQSPANLPALRGAAKLAAKSGATDRAKDLYERLLAADPQNATAKAYLAKHAPQDTPAPEPNEESAPPSGG